MKLYKYRPLSELLFKELYYQELYFSSYKELNDPLDLNARIEFTPENENKVEYLIYFLVKTSLKISVAGISEEDKKNNDKLTIFWRNETLAKKFQTNVYEKIISAKKKDDFISFKMIEEVLISSIKELGFDFKIDLQCFRDKLEKLKNKFLANSYVTCFSATNSNFLMWSHYANSHKGICLEFTLDDSGQFPYKLNGKRDQNNSKYLERMSEWSIQEFLFWEGVNEVDYVEEQPFINFFDFGMVFENEHDCDLIGLSKSKWHGYAHELKRIFATKTKPWMYEKEWRAIEINFGETQDPEERIRHYPIECLSGIYFGMKTPEQIKKRIHSIFRKNKKINYFNCKSSNGKDIDFEDWEFFE